MKKIVKKIGVCLLSSVLAATAVCSAACDGRKEEPSKESTQNWEEVTLPAPRASYSFEDVKDGSTYNSATGRHDKLNYVFNKENAGRLWKEPSAPLTKQGVVGRSLYMDGFSTNVQTTDFETPDTAITLSAWVAPRVFENLPYYGGVAAGHPRLTSIVNEGNLEETCGFAFGYGRLGLWGMQLALTRNDGQSFVVGFYDPINTLPLYEWSHLAATYDGTTGYIALMYNGEKVYEDLLPDLMGTRIIDSDRGNLYIGAYTAPDRGEYGDPRQIPAGLLDEVNIYGASFTPLQVRKLYHAGTAEGNHPSLAYSEVALDSSVYEGDRYRPQYHALPPAVWMNEPHSPFYYKGRYHVFYQCNPAGPYWSQIRWGHIVSDDMVHWEYVKDAVVPTAGICPEGLWTGGACIGPDGTPWLALTAGTNLYGSGNPSGQNVAFAHCVNPDDPDLTDWVIEDTLTVTHPNDNSMGQREQFRDPFVWYDDETKQYFMLVATSVPGAGGTANIYTSRNMHEWTHHGFLYECPYPQYAVAGEHWECVVLLPIHTKDGKTTKYVLFDCPQYDGNERPSTADPIPPVECYYWIGTFDKENCRFIPDNHEPKLFDIGAAIYTGQNGYCFLTDEERAAGKTFEEGRTVIYSIAQGKAVGTSRFKDAGWAHNFAFPLELWLADNGTDLIREPIREIESLYGKVEYAYENAAGMRAEDVNTAIKDVRGDTLRIDLKFTIEPTAANYAARIGVRYNLFRKSIGTERTFINFANGELRIDRLQSTLMQGCVTESLHGWNYRDTREFEVTILLDRCMLEVYVNGTVSATERIYPMYGDSDYIRFADEDAGMKITKLKITQMKSAYSADGSITPAYFGNTGYLAQKA